MKAFIFLFVLTFSMHSYSIDPNCERWPTNISYAHLKNESIVSPYSINHEKTKAVLLASEEVGEDEYEDKLYKQIYLITFYKNDGQKISAITTHTASEKECSYSEVTVYLISDIYKNGN